MRRSNCLNIQTRHRDPPQAEKQSRPFDGTEEADDSQSLEFNTLFRYSDGVVPVVSLNIPLKLAFELKPAIKCNREYLQIFPGWVRQIFLYLLNTVAVYEIVEVLSGLLC